MTWFPTLFNRLLRRVRRPAPWCMHRDRDVTNVYLMRTCGPCGPSGKLFQPKGGVRWD